MAENGCGLSLHQRALDGIRSRYQKANRHARTRDHDHGNRLRRGQIAHRRRRVPLFRQCRLPRGPLQAAEHVEQRGCHPGRRRDRPRPGAAGPRRALRDDGGPEPGAAQAAERGWRADRGTGQGDRLGPRARISGPEARADACRARKLRAAARGLRPRVRRRRGQRVRDQSARQRHREHGLRAGGGAAGGARGRYRPGRGDREPRGHETRAGARGCRADKGLHRQ